MPLDASALLDGPRGRRLCLEVLLEGARRADTPETRDAVQAVFWAAHGRERGASVLLSFSDGPEPFAKTEVTARDAAAALAALPVPAMTAETLTHALWQAVDEAAYWQPPSGMDELAAAAEMHSVLRRVANGIALSRHVDWWASPLARQDQAAVAWEEEPFRAGHPGEILPEWRTDTAAEELQFEGYTGVSGPWWSAPPFGLPRTTRVGERGPVGLSFVEDSHGWLTARSRGVTPPAGDVVEIDGPEAWAALCRRHPLVVTASRRTVWEWATGRDGAWVIPDWAGVAREAVGVHLTVTGYLTSAGRIIDVGGGLASTVAGWVPDETFWFRDVVQVGAEHRWAAEHNMGVDRWHPA
ncbi:hypothetical protein ACF044_14900 [Microbacterium sp. NPDC016588]